MTRRKGYYGFGGPVISARAAEANLRRHVAEAVDGEYKHPAGGVMRACGTCDGYGLVRNGFVERCADCDGTGVVAG